MAHIITHNIASLPLFQDGYTLGLDTGLRVALDALTAERGRQERLAAQHPDATLAYVCAARRLLDVTRVIAARFRQ